ncbi:MAG TPA: fimbria/pilus outer membrane usher protein [Usitatibacter sp.]|nr:fimbria/pilus outer membrane usher protein [Usitatibacter sp.]
MFVLAPGALAQVGNSAVAPSATQDRIFPLDVTVNGAKGGTWVFIERNGALYAPRDAFDEWRIQLKTDVVPIDFKGEPYWPLAAVPGFKVKIDHATQSANLVFDAQSFTALRLEKEIVKRPPVSTPVPSVFLNYDFNYTGQVLKAAPTVNDVGLLTEVGASGAWGVLTSSQVMRHVTAGVEDDQVHPFLRLETTLTHDFPESNRTLRIGDATTRPGTWGRAVYFGGVQFGTNFALTPGFVSQPIPSVRGLSTAPSTVELYVNDVLRQVSSVPTGPFAIDNFPIVSGTGDARVVVRDLLGRETVIVQPFFASSQLLAPGLNDWSFEMGKVRRDMGVEPDDYGETFASGTWKRGITDRLTLEAHAEATSQMRNLGVTALTGLPLRMLGTLSVAASDTKGIGTGTNWLVGLERNTQNSSFTFQALGNTANFRMLGQDDLIPPNRLQIAGSYTWFSDKWGSLGLGFARIEPVADADVTTISVNYSITLMERASLNVSATRAIVGTTGNSFGLSFTMPLDNSRTLTASTTTRDSRTDAYVAASRTPGIDGSLGWRALAGTQEQRAHGEAGLYYMGSKGTVSSDFATDSERTALRVGVNGGVVAAAGSVFTTRRLEQSFAVAQLDGYPNVGVGLGSTVLAKTDANGTALIPNIWPYQANSVRLDPKDLPISAELDSIEQVAVPAWRSGVLVKFPVRGGRGALLRIAFDDGEVAPAGATVHIEGDKEIFYVARRGEAFVTGLKDHDRVVLDWEGHSCAFDVALPPPSPDEVPRLGPFACKGVQR